MCFISLSRIYKLRSSSKEYNPNCSNGGSVLSKMFEVVFANNYHQLFGGFDILIIAVLIAMGIVIVLRIFMDTPILKV